MCYEAVLDESGRIQLSYECERRWLMYAWKLKWNERERMLQKLCMEGGLNENKNVSGRKEGFFMFLIYHGNAEEQ